VNTTVSIVGGGLSGLYVAFKLAARNIDFTLFESRERLGGRIRSEVIGSDMSDGQTGPGIDLGPAWFWPGQYHVAELLRELDLEKYVFEQSSDGDSIIEYANGSVQSVRGGASMAGSLRLSSGMRRLIDRLLDGIPTDNIVTSGTVVDIAHSPEGVKIIANSNERQLDVFSQYAVLALPPRVTVESIQFSPELGNETISKLRSVPTWMAAEAKFVAVYDKPFWRHRHLSGDALSQIGPLTEIHDASPEHGGPYALFGFVGVPAVQRFEHEHSIKSASIEQLARMFGDDALSPVAIFYKDWAFDQRTSTEQDRRGVRSHPMAGLELHQFPDSPVLWAGTETADSLNQSNGYLEGAIEAGNRAVSLLSTMLGETNTATLNKPR